MRTKKTSLGKGLSSILGNNILGERKDSVITNINQIELSKIQLNPFQPRNHFDMEKLNELAISIEQLGVIQPITVRKMNNDEYQLISGERRLRASKIAELKRIPAFIRVANDKEMLEMALVENIQREDLNPIEIALSYKRLINEIKLTQEQCSERVGKNRSTVTNFLRLLKLPSEIQKGLKEKLISNGHARALLSISNKNSQINIYHDIINFGYSVREVEQISKDFSESEYSRISKKTKSTNLTNLSFNQQKIIHEISQKISQNIEIKKNKNGTGKILIKFNNDAELDDILKSIN